MAFQLAGELVRQCLYCKTVSNAGTGLVALGVTETTVEVLFADFYTQEMFTGSVILQGDEKCLIRARELSSIASPGPGDCVVEMSIGLWREIINARLDPTRTFWVLQVRRVTNDDWGDLTAAARDEDWGGLTATLLIDDWQN